ncbi:hypothetical protein MY11210_002644 [Beauveria gryllotalpidicola]
MAAEDKVTPTDGEIRILMAIFAHMSGKPDVDWDAAAADASLSNAKSLKERYRQMCVRHGWNKKRRGAGAAGNAPSAPRNMASPSKVVKSAGGGKKRKQDDREEEEEEQEQDDDDDGVQEERKMAVVAAGLDGEY